MSRAAIVGVHEYPHRNRHGTSPMRIKADAALAALADAGLSPGDVDALFDAGETGGHALLHMAEYLGIDPTVVGGTDVGGSAFEFHVAEACRAIEAGHARVALLTYAETPRSSRLQVGPPGSPLPRPAGNMELPWGLNIVGNYAMVAARHMALYGTTPEHLAEIAVVSRSHALRNPVAVAGLQEIGIEPVELSIDDVVGSRLIADPLRLLDCCLVTDGGGAVVIAAADVAADARHAPAWILGTGIGLAYPDNRTDITVTAAATSGPRAFAAAGVQPADIDVALLYDSFTITVLTALEDLGFCAKGDGGAYVADGRLRVDTPGGPVLNPDGGGLSSCHPGMRGIFLLIEAARQLRGEATTQVADAELVVVHGNGAFLGTRHAAGTVIVGRS